MPRRSYDQYCGLARALDVLGERWTLLIVRNLLLGPQRYSELLRGLPGITTNLLAKRLREMEAEGIIDRTGGATDAYRLTEVGRSLEPAIHALGQCFVFQLMRGSVAEELVQHFDELHEMECRASGPRTVAAIACAAARDVACWRRNRSTLSSPAL